MSKPAGSRFDNEPQKYSLEYLKGLYQYNPTPSQEKYLDAIISENGVRAAARSLNIDHPTIVRSLKRLRISAAKQGYDPHNGFNRTVASGFGVKGVSTLYDAEGNVKAEWVKTNAQQEEKTQAFLEVVQEYASNLQPIPQVKSPYNNPDDLMNMLIVTDFHLGMRTDGAENGGEAWDLKIATETLLECIRSMITEAPKAKQCIFANLGDMLHADGVKPFTPTSGHVLDVTGRFRAVAECAVDLILTSIRMLLEEYEIVHVLMAEGNHDIDSSGWLKIIVKQMFRDNPRVNLIDSAVPYYAIQHGKTMIGFHHGHLSKKQKLPEVFADKYSKIWGATKYRYINTGHYHHEDRKGYIGCKVYQHETLSPNDSYSARGGYSAERAASVMTFCKRKGLKRELLIKPDGDT